MAAHVGGQVAHGCLLVAPLTLLVHEYARLFALFRYLRKNEPV